MSDTVATLGVEIRSSGFAEFTSNAKAATSAANDLDKAFGPLNSNVQQLNQSFGPVVGGFTSYTKAVNEAAKSHAGFSTQSMAAFHSVRSLTEAVVAGQSPVQALAQQFNHLSYAATGPGGLAGAFSSVAAMIGPTGLIIGGFAAVGLAAAAVAIPFQKLGDEIYRNQKFFEGLTGSSKQGAAALTAVQAVVKNSNGDLGVFKDALQKISEGQAQFANKSIVYANSQEQNRKNTEKAADALGVLNKIMEQSGATAKEEAAVFGALSGSIQKTGTFTVDAFQKIRDASPIMALRIAQIFGQNDVEQFRRELERVPIPLDDIIRKFQEVKPAVDAATDTSRSKTWEQATREMSNSWSHLLETVANTGVFTGIANVISGIAKALDIATAAAGNFARAVAAIPSAASTIGNVLANPGAALARQLGAGEPQLDLQAVSPAGGTDFGFFASGGSFVVGGTGGTDSQKVTFNATPGEVVTIATPDQAASGIASLTPAGGTSNDIEDLLKDQTKAIVDAINGLKQQQTTNAVSAAAVSAGLPIPSAVGGGGGTTAFGAGASSGGAVGGGSSNPFKQLQQEQQKRQAELDARERELGGGGNVAGTGDFAGLVRGGTTVYGSSARLIAAPTGPFATGAAGGPVTINPASTVPVNPGSSFQSQDALDAKALRDNTNKTNRNLDAANRNLDDVQRSTEQTTQKVETGGENTVNAVDRSGNVISAAIESLGSMFSSAMSNIGAAAAQEGQMFGPAVGGAGFGGGGGGANDNGYSGGGDSTVSGFGSSGYGSSGYNGGTSSNFSGFDAGGGFNDAFGSSSSNGTDFSGFDASSAFDDAFAGSFAKGGSFVVGGDGGTDTTPIGLMATRGERITITPAGVRMSSSTLNPGANDNGATISRTVQHITHRNVTIQVHEGISADTVLRSRAQIRRAMGG